MPVVIIRYKLSIQVHIQQVHSKHRRGSYLGTHGKKQLKGGRIVWLWSDRAQSITAVAMTVVGSCGSETSVLVSQLKAQSAGGAGL